MEWLLHAPRAAINSLIVLAKMNSTPAEHDGNIFLGLWQAQNSREVRVGVKYSLLMSDGINQVPQASSFPGFWMCSLIVPRRRVLWNSAPIPEVAHDAK